jgi:hypothetical protein
MFKYDKVYAQSYDIFQKVGKPSHRGEFLLHLVCALQAFEKWDVNFIGPITPSSKHSKARYINNENDYLTCLIEAKFVQDFSTTTTSRFIFENIITRFGCPQILTNNQGAHFISETITTLTREFLIQHHNNSPYHLQENGTMEAFNKILKMGLNKVCC